MTRRISPLGRDGAARAALLLLVLVAMLAGAAYVFRDLIPFLPAVDDTPAEVSEATAASAEAKLAGLASGDTVTLTATEFTSLLRYRYRGSIPGDLLDPAARFENGEVHLSGRIPTDRLPDVPQLQSARAFLPDTADVAVNGGLRTLAPGRGALKVRTFSFARIPVPHDVVVKHLGRREDGLAEDEVALRLPEGVGAVEVRDSLLVLAPAR
jgi:hypothetical protein